MRINIGTLMFNMNTATGGTPSWGTDLGQSENNGYKFVYDDIDELIKSLAYCSVPFNKVYCPLGKGGSRQDDYEYVLAGLFKKVYVNNELVDNAQFLLLIVKQVKNDSGFFVGRRTLKYSINMTYDEEKINKDCIDKIKNHLQLNDNSAWFVSSIDFRNQDELNFNVIVCGNEPIDFANADERKEYVNKKISSEDPNFLAVAKGGFNKIYYGAPGCGKSYKLKKELETIPDRNKIRTTFHPEYSNTDFVGQILPKIEPDGKVTYKFNPGPFTLALQRAYHTKDMVYLIIEEINRGNASAIFGDLFQLLDREKADNENPLWGQSEYPINNPHVQRYLGLLDDDCIVIPRNLTILATMNSSDQNVFTLDTAFKRRWKFELVDNDIVNDSEHSYKNWYVPFSNVTWENFVLAINKKIMSSTISQLSEDKRLGKYFVTKDCLVENPGDQHESEAAKNFSYKVLEYLWHDVCKINKDEWFDIEQYQTLDDLVEDFIAGCECNDSLQVFKDKELMFRDEN